MFWKKAIWHRPCAFRSSSPPRGRKNLFPAVHGGSSGLAWQGEQAPLLPCPGWSGGLSRADVSSDAVFMNPFTHQGKALGSLSHKSRAFTWALHCPLPSITQRNEELAVESSLGRQAITLQRVALNMCSPVSRMFLLVLGVAWLTLVQLQLQQSGHHPSCSTAYRDTATLRAFANCGGDVNSLYAQNCYAWGTDIMNGSTGTWYHIPHTVNSSIGCSLKKLLSSPFW